MKSEITLSFAKITISLDFVGDDIFILVKGGEKPHIGATVLAVPRPSLTGDKSISTTSSVLNVTGHKDEVICRMLAEKASKTYGVTAVCAGGFHVDNMKEEQIKEVVSAVRNFDLQLLQPKN